MGLALQQNLFLLILILEGMQIQNMIAQHHSRVPLSQESGSNDAIPSGYDPLQDYSRKHTENVQNVKHFEQICSNSSVQDIYANKKASKCRNQLPNTRKLGQCLHYAKITAHFKHNQEKIYSCTSSGMSFKPMFQSINKTNIPYIISFVIDSL